MVAVFDGRGVRAAGAPGTRFGSALVQTVLAERDFFENGARKETDDPHYRRVGDYWQALGLPYDGRSLIPIANGTKERPAWSAAFISWVIAQHGVGPDRFRGRQGHCRYVEDALEGSLPDPLLEVSNPGACCPQPGDLVHCGRGREAAHYDFAAARAVLSADAFYASHSDFVVSVDTERGKITTVGGNVSNSVKESKWDLDSEGFLRPRKVGRNSYPWIAVLRLRDG